MSFLFVVGSAMLVSTGIVIIVYALYPRPIRLDDALAYLDSPVESGHVHNIIDSSSSTERLGAWLYRTGVVALSDRTARLLDIQGRTISDFVVHKLIVAIAMGGGSFAALSIFIPISAIHLIVFAVGSAIGWFVPNIQLAHSHQTIRDDAAEAINSFFDLVILERMANLSAVQAIEHASLLSEAPIFVQIRQALERSRYEQRAPWTGLCSLARRLDLDELEQMADVMRLDEQGASLSEALLNRVSQLRDSHLMKEKMRAHRRNEQLTIWMTLPVLIFALAFLIPPLMTITS